MSNLDTSKTQKIDIDKGELSILIAYSKFLNQKDNIEKTKALFIYRLLCNIILFFCRNVDLVNQSVIKLCLKS